MAVTKSEVDTDAIPYSGIGKQIEHGKIQILSVKTTITLNSRIGVEFVNAVFVDKSLTYNPTIVVTEKNQLTQLEKLAESQNMSEQPQMMTQVMSEFHKQMVTTPTIANLKNALGKIQTKSKSEWNSELRSVKYDNKKWTTLQAFYDRLTTLARLSLGDESRNTSKEALEIISDQYFRDSLPSWVKKEPIFSTSEQSGTQLVALATRLISNKKENEHVNFVYPAKAQYKPNKPYNKNSEGAPRSGKKPYPPKTQSAEERKKGRKCHFCGKLGHYWGECYGRQRAIKEGTTTDEWRPPVVKKVQNANQ